jgi:hypothetical protein
MPVARHRFRPCIAAHRAPRSPLTGSHHHAPSVLSASKLPRRRDTKLWVVLDRRTEPRSKYRRSTLPAGVCCSSRDDDPGTNHSTDCPLGRTVACHTQGSGEITAPSCFASQGSQPRAQSVVTDLYHGCPTPRPNDPRHYDCPPVPVSHRSQRSNPEPPGRIDPHQSGTGACTPSRAPSAVRSKLSRTELAARHRVTPADPTKRPQPQAK